MCPVIHTSQLTRAFAGRPAVRSIDLSVPRGAIYAFLGPNGAGKSTTIRLVLGLLQPDSGSIAVFGLPLATHRLEILSRVGALVESPSLYPHLTATENLAIPARLLGRGSGDITRALSTVGLANVGGKLARHFSLGMKQRLGLALALLADPELLILDEPTNGLDPAGIQEIRELMRSLSTEHGVTVFVSSHLLSEVDQLATHVGILSQGALVFQGTAEVLAQRRRNRLRIVVDRPADAVVTLAARGWVVTRENDTVTAGAEVPAAVLNRTLVEAGHDVHAMTLEADSLEDVFLGMTHAEVR
jgi:ABC-2 type transport system ATP-binding protein